MNLLLPFLLFYYHQVSCLDFNTYKHASKLYSKSLISVSFDTNFGMSWIYCMQKCKEIRNCKSVNYKRRSGLCELNSVDQTTNPEGLQTRGGVTFSPKYEWDFTEPDHCTSCSEGELCSLDQNKQCEIIGCPLPPPVAGAKILGNLFTVRTKRLYRCSNGVQQVSVCHEDGSWSPVNIICSCGEIEIENAIVDITEYDDGGKEAKITCNHGFFHRSVDKIQCTAATLTWTNHEQVGCIAIYDEPWTKVYRILKGLTKNVDHLWSGNSRPEIGEFRNDEVIYYWTNKGIKQIKVDIKDTAGNTVASLIFDGQGTDFRYWFSTDKLINSTWDDLTRDSPVSYFKIAGVKVNNASYLRWVILNVENDENILNCSEDMVWLAITREGKYPCTKFDEMHKRVIIYSKGPSGATWEGGQLSQAEELVVSVWME